MSQPFVGEIRMFSGNFAPRSWAFCDGQLMAISQNDALFSLLGTIYGGDGTTTFGLPDLRGRVPLGEGTGSGLSPRRLGSKSGAEKITLTRAQVPSHTHSLQADLDAAKASTPTGRVLGNVAPYEMYEDFRSLDIIPLNEDCIGTAGGGQPHANMMPSLCVNFIIALFGVYPSRH